MKDIKIKVDVTDLLKQIQKHCQNNDCCDCKFAYIDRYHDVCCALSKTPMRWDLEKLKERK